MKPQSARIHRSALLLLLVAVVHHDCSSASAQDPGTAKLPPSVLEGLTRNVTAVRAIRVDGTWSQHAYDMKSDAGSALTTFSLQIDQGKFYCRRQLPTRLNDGAQWDLITEQSFDGNIFYFGDPHRAQADNALDIPALLSKFSVDDAADPHRDTAMIWLPYFKRFG